MSSNPTRRLRSSMARAAMVCALTFLVASCGSSSSSKTDAAAPDTTAATAAPDTTAAAVAETTAAPAATEAAAPDSTTDSTTAMDAVTQTGTGYLVSLENGDRACYVGISASVDSDAEPQQLPGSFELCPGGKLDASLFIGSAVTYRTTKAKIAAASCQGAPDCKDSDEVDLVIEVLPATTPNGTAGDTTAALEIDGLPLDTTAAAIVQKFGEPDSKTPVQEEGATGEFVSTWTWAGKGVTAKMAATTATGAPVVRSLTVYAPSTLKTVQGIGIGDSVAAVKAAYGSKINAEESKPDTIVVGSIFGGIIITTTNDKVSGIFVGAAAE